SARAPYCLRGPVVCAGAHVVRHLHRYQSAASRPGRGRTPGAVMTTHGSLQPGAADRRQRRLLIGLALLFFAPLGLAFFLYYGHWTWHPGGRVNAGDLVEPPRPLPALALPLLGSGSTEPNFLKGKWTLLYVRLGPCGERCRKRL